MEHGSMEYSSRQRYWVLEIKLVSCKDLKAFNFFQKLSVYAIVSLKVISDDAVKKVKEAEEQMDQEVVEQQIKKTPTDGEGDGNPEWNHEMRFEFDHNDDHRQLKDGRLLIHFDLRHQGLGILGIGDRSIGEVRVPLNDLMIPYIPPSPANNSGLGLGGVQQQQQQQQQQQRARYVNYQVRTSDEKPNGILTFSYKLKLLIKGAGTDDQPRIQYPTITLEEDDDHDIMHKFNNTNSDITSSRSQQQQQQQQEEEYYYTSNISSAAPAPAHNNNYSQSQSQLQADHQQICSSCLPQYHHPYDPPVAVAVAGHGTYYPRPPPPPPPPPPPQPMADHGASYPYHPPCPPHPYHDYGPWSPPAGIGRPHGHGHGHEHGFF